MTGRPELERLATQFLRAQLAGNRLEALRLVTVEGLEAGFSVRDLQLEVIARAQLEIGRLWQENRVTVAQEHLATAIAQLALARLYPYLERRESTGTKVLIACVEGEMHDMGPRICTDFLEAAGFEVRFLGADVPNESLAKMTESEKPDVIVLSLTLPVHVGSLGSAVRAIRAVDAKVPIVAGGNAFAWDPAIGAELGLFATGTDVDTLVAAVKRAVP